MEVSDTLHTLEEGDKVTTDVYSQTLTVTDVMFDGEMVEVEGPRGGEKCLVENVNSGTVRVTVGGSNKGVVNELEIA